MKTAKLISVAVALLLTGACATHDVNPSRPKPNTGYVDFQTDDDSPLCWQIQRLAKDQPRGKILFEEFKPRTNALLRLSFPPGQYRLGVTFLNRAITQPGVANVIIHDASITPVRVTLVETGKALTQTREVHVGGTFYGVGRSTKLRAGEGATFRVEIETREPLTYQPKEQMMSASDMEKSD